MQWLLRLRTVFSESRMRQIRTPAELSENMIRYWTQFATSGNPNAPGLLFWPRYDNAADRFQSLVPPSPLPEFRFATDHKCDFWGRLFGTSIQLGALPR